MVSKDQVRLNIKGIKATLAPLVIDNTLTLAEAVEMGKIMLADYLRRESILE